MPDLFTAPEENNNSKFAAHSNLPQQEESHIHSLASFCQNPTDTSFKTQAQDEVIILLLRAHFVTNIPWIVIVLILSTLPFFVFLAFNVINISISFLPLPFLQISLALYYLILFAYAFISFITWFYNTFLITTKRIVDIDFSDVLYHNMAITKLELIEDVDYSQTGFIRSFFNYGDVFIQTAGDKPNFEALGIPKPAEVIHIVGDLIGRRPHA